MTRPGLRIVPPTKPDLYAEWLQRERETRRPLFVADRFSTPAGLLWFAGTLLPICVAAFCVGYFGLRELLAGFGL